MRKLAFKTMLDHLAYEGLPAELLACYTAELNRLLREIDQKERTALGQEYPTREAAANARQTYTQLEQSVHKPDAPKHAEAIRKQIAQADLPEATKEALRTTLFQKEHATRIARCEGIWKSKHMDSDCRNHSESFSFPVLHTGFFRQTLLYSGLFLYAQRPEYL